MHSRCKAASRSPRSTSRANRAETQVADTECGQHMRQVGRARMEQLLPLTDAQLGEPSGSKDNWDYIYEPEAKPVIDQLLLRYVESLVYSAVTENQASEQRARMVAKKAASDNAKSVIGELKLVYNKARQAAITKEISEIVGGAAAV